MIEKLITVKFYFQRQENSISIFDSGAEEIATWDLIGGLKGLENWSLTEQYEIANNCIRIYLSVDN